MPGLKLDRTLPTRVSLSSMAALCFIITMVGIGLWQLPPTETYGALAGLFAVLGVAIGGDTYRPSGQAVAAHHAHKVLTGPKSRGEDQPE